jgi:hypothetical protein
LGAILTAGAQGQKEKAAEAATACFTIVIALLPSIDVLGTLAIGSAETTLHRPTRQAAIPCATARVAVIVVMMAVMVVMMPVIVVMMPVIVVMIAAIAISGRPQYAADADCADDAQRRPNFPQSSHDSSSLALVYKDNVEPGLSVARQT